MLVGDEGYYQFLIDLDKLKFVNDFTQNLTITTKVDFLTQTDYPRFFEVTDPNREKPVVTWPNIRSLAIEGYVLELRKVDLHFPGLRHLELTQNSYLDQIPAQINSATFHNMT